MKTVVKQTPPDETPKKVLGSMSTSQLRQIIRGLECPCPHCEKPLHTKCGTKTGKPVDNFTQNKTEVNGLPDSPITHDMVFNVRRVSCQTRRCHKGSTILPTRKALEEAGFDTAPPEFKFLHLVDEVIKTPRDTIGEVDLPQDIPEGVNVLAINRIGGGKFRMLVREQDQLKWVGRPKEDHKDDFLGRKRLHRRFVRGF